MEYYISMLRKLLTLLNRQPIVFQNLHNSDNRGNCCLFEHQTQPKKNNQVISSANHEIIESLLTALFEQLIQVLFLSEYDVLASTMSCQLSFHPT
jgi:hypothetical protein